MNYAERDNPAKHLPSIILVGILHLVVGYALVNGLARRVVEVLKQPLETKIIEEIKKPPPDTPPPPPPKLAAPPPPFIPPPEINIQVPVVQQAATITAVTTAKPPPGPPPVVHAAPQQQPTIRKEYKASYRVNPAYPRALMREGVEGRVVAWVHVAPNGSVTDVEIRQSTNHAFDREVVRALSQWKFNPEPVGFIGEYEIIFNLKD